MEPIVSRAHSLREAIRGAFPLAPLPPEPEGWDVDLQFCKNGIGGRPWDALTPEDAFQLTECFIYWPAEVSRYYLPGFLSAALSALVEPGYLFGSIMVNFGAFLEQGRESVWDQMTPAQRLCVSEFASLAAEAEVANSQAAFLWHELAREWSGP
jgi:hypothetical protein